MKPRPPYHVDMPRDAAPGSEATIQATFRALVRQTMPAVKLVAIPNAGKRSLWEGRQRKTEGLVKGFPDMMALWGGKAVFLEFKSKTGCLKDEQKACLLDLTERGFPCGVFRSPDSALAWLKYQGWPEE